jgi:hypothetical protein
MRGIRRRHPTSDLDTDEMTHRDRICDWPSADVVLVEIVKE